jgi:hypothetical protein
VKRIMVETILADPAYEWQIHQEPPLKLANLFGDLVVTSPEYRNRATPRDQAETIFSRKPRRRNPSTPTTVSGSCAPS